MKEKRLQKNSVFSVKTDCILLITALIASILFLISPFAVSAQELMLKIQKQFLKMKRKLYQI